MTTTTNLYFHYRDNNGLPVADYPNYLDLRTDALNYLGAIDTSRPARIGRSAKR